MAFMSQNSYSRIIVKVGTNVITTADGLLDLPVVTHLVEQIVALREQGVEVVLISSGAMGCGRSLIKVDKGVNPVVKRQVLASIGQVKLMQTYLQLFQMTKHLCAQVLVTKEDFRDRMHYMNMKNCFEALLSQGVVPIVNENDVISVDELMFTDNDELACFAASMLEADGLFILSSVEGIFDRDPSAEGASLIATVDAKTSLQKYISTSKSLFGRGGMLTKAKMGQKMASMGIRTVIANGQRHNVLCDLVAGQNIGTHFVPSDVKSSSMRCWLATRESYEKGTIFINAGAERVLRTKIASLLPIGITKVVGDFQKGDIITIRTEETGKVGWGIAAYGSELARTNIGQQRKKALINYDHLFFLK